MGITFVDVHLNWFNWFHSLFVEGGLLIILIDCMIFQSPFLMLQRCLCLQFFPSTARLGNSLPIECFPLAYDLNGFKSGINRPFCTSFSCNFMAGSGSSALHRVNPNKKRLNSYA